MKLSDVKGERTFDVIAEIIEPIANIAQDKAAKELFEKRVCPEGVDPRDFMAARIKKAAPGLLKSHKKDIIKIAAAIEGVTDEEYTETLTLGSLLKDLIEMFTDEELLTFYPSQR